MRIVNVTAFRRPFSYAATSSGGVELDPGAAGPEIPVARVFDDPLIMKDVDAGVAMIRLSEEDRKTLNRLLEEGSRKLQVAQPPKRPTKPKKKKPAAKQAAAKKAAAKKPLPPAKAVTEGQVQDGQVSLADLQHGNTDKATKLAEIRTHMGGPMGSVIETGVPK